MEGDTMNALEKYVSKVKLAHALKEKLANPDLSGGRPSTSRPGMTVYPVKPAAAKAPRPLKKDTRPLRKAIRPMGGRKNWHAAGF